MPTINYTIFLASSEELSTDRTAFGDIVQEYNDQQKKLNRHVNFLLYKWERDTASFSERRKQNEYNENIESCQVFIMLYWSKVGMYTEEEFDFAWNRFTHPNNSGFPKIFVLEKTNNTEKEENVYNFNKKLIGPKGQFRSTYKTKKELRNYFFKELDILFANGVLVDGIPAITVYNDGQSVPSNFIGREEELLTIEQRLNENNKLMIINAEGGIGKTTLAAKYWQQRLYNYKYNAWLFCEEGINSTIKKLAPHFNIDLSNMSEEAQMEKLKTGLQNVSHDFLLVLDNANNPEHIEAFKTIFRGFHWHVLLTSRCNGILVTKRLREPIRSFNFMNTGSSAGVAFSSSACLQQYWHRRCESIASLLPRTIPRLHLIWAALPMWSGRFCLLQKAHKSRWYTPVFSITNKLFPSKVTRLFFSHVLKAFIPAALLSNRSVAIGCFTWSITTINDTSNHGFETSIPR